MAALSLYVLFWPDPVGADSSFPGADKVVHVGLFLLLAVTARARFGAASQVLASLVLYAVVSEAAQAMLLGQRSGDWVDVLADLVGVALGWTAAQRLRR